MSEFNTPSQEDMGMSADALKHEDIKDKINLSYAKRSRERRDGLMTDENSYSGVCDVISPEAAREMADELRECRKNPNRKIMVGVMTTPVALNPDLPVPPEVRREISETIPAKEDIAGAFTDDPDVLNTIHYADLYGPKGPWKAAGAPDLLENLELSTQYGGENLHAIQLDVTWPASDELKEFKERHPKILTILQVGKFALREVDNDPQKMVDKLREYGSSIDYVLLDMSMGKGMEMDSAVLKNLLSLIQWELPGLGLAVAGGLGPDSMDALKPIADEFPNISIDAQGRLKPEDSPRDSSGHLVSTVSADLTRAKTYIEKSCQMLDGAQDSPNKISWI